MFLTPREYLSFTYFPCNLYKKKKKKMWTSIRPVWSESSLCAQCVAKNPMLLHADSEDSDQTGRMPRLIWVFARRTAILLVLSCRESYTLGPKYPRYMYTRTYKTYTHLYWVQEIHEHINLKEYISSIMLFGKKNILFLLCPEKIFWLSDCEKKISVFLSEENLEEKTQAAPPP